MYFLEMSSLIMWKPNLDIHTPQGCQIKQGAHADNYTPKSPWELPYLKQYTQNSASSHSLVSKVLKGLTMHLQY